MSQIRTWALAALMVTTVAFPALSWAKLPPVHSVWAKKPGVIVDQGVTYLSAFSDSAVSWQEYVGPAFVHARAFLATGDIYEFTLVTLLGSPGYDQIDGYWDVTLNGWPLCSGCKGSALGLSAGVGSGYKISVNAGQYAFSGIITDRYDY